MLVVGIHIVHWVWPRFTYSIEFIGGYVVAFLGVEEALAKVAAMKRKASSLLSHRTNDHVTHVTHVTYIPILVVSI